MNKKNFDSIKMHGTNVKINCFVTYSHT